VDHHIPVVEQDPSRVRGAFLVEEMDILLLKSLRDSVCNSFYLAGAFAGADDEVVGKPADVAGVQ
jgi:hypothetical protein